MATQVALLVSGAILALMLPLFTLKCFIKRTLAQKHGMEAAECCNDKMRFALVTTATLAIVLAVLMLDPQMLAPGSGLR
ncbi:hypothetical protein [Sagittula stellata]|uniref:Uncharacterized protein n=1 Tax=Sagittula stellata (strain ATCC 700073 / DSM 11524 / E-37) TaxID=388399 RepID=A3KAD4_SAGS3|nr:hypothetical protein [Sagittula stellata]EBA05925.1 hypothetical protein SSE37_15913 [Sagittula stellata E-37]